RLCVTGLDGWRESTKAISTGPTGGSGIWTSTERTRLSTKAGHSSGSRRAPIGACSSGRSAVISNVPATLCDGQLRIPDPAGGHRVRQTSGPGGWASRPADLRSGGWASSPADLRSRWMGLEPGARAFCGHRTEANPTFRPLRLGAVTTNGESQARVSVDERLSLHPQPGVGGLLDHGS